MSERFLTWLLLEPGQTLIRVKSWVPCLGPYGIEWPHMLVDSRGGHRQTASPVWNRAMLRHIFHTRAQ